MKITHGDGSLAQVFVQIAARDGVLDLRFDLELGPGLRTLAVAVRDELSRETSFVSTTLAVPAPGPVVSELH